jgi:hypothetical protein
MRFYCLSSDKCLAILASTLFLLCALGCAQEEAKRSAPDVSHIQLDTRFERFDQELFATDTNKMEAGLTALQAKYPDFLTIFASEIIGDQYNPNETPAQALAQFLRAPELRNLYDTVQLTFPNVAQAEKDVNQVLKYYKYYFPERPTPRVLGIISEFGPDAFIYSDSGVGIGLDMFLGADFSAYSGLIPDYIKRTFEPAYIPIKLAKVLARDQAGNPPGQRLIDLMVHNGKILYINGLLTPFAHDSLLMGYTQEKMEGCYFNEKAVWKRILDEKLLYSTDRGDIRKLVEPSPNAPKVFDEAPGEIGNWIGWRIVESYMIKHPTATIADLLAMRDSQKLMEEASYKPKR